MKKLLLSFMALLVFSFSANAQNNYPPTGNVGFGTNSATAGLEVKNNNGINIVSQQYTWKGSIKMVDALTNTSHRDDMMFSTPGGFIFKMDENQNGISGIAGFNVYDRNLSPLLQISESNGNVTVNALSLTGSNPIKSVNSFNNRIEFVGNHGAIVSNPGMANEIMFGLSSNGNFYWGTGGATATNPNYYAMWLDASNGNLGIRGKLTADEAEIKVGGWADFVFEDEYNLPSLEEVETYIKEKGHLQDIPSAEEVKENGIKLGEMNAKLLQKIEELMLYTIEQQKEINDLKKGLQDLKG